MKNLNDFMNNHTCSLIEFINEAASANDVKSFFKDWKKFRESPKRGEELYKVVDSWIEKYNLTLLDEKKLEKPTNQAIMTLLLSKKKEHFLLDVAITKPSKKSEIEGMGTVNLSEDTWLNTVEEYDKWRKAYRGITVLQFAFPNGFFDKIRANLGDKLS